jgi:hypothetical protein
MVRGRYIYYFLTALLVCISGCHQLEWGAHFKGFGLLHRPQDAQSLCPLKPLLIVTRHVRHSDGPASAASTVSDVDLGLPPTASLSAIGPNAKELQPREDVVFTWQIIFVPDVLQKSSFELVGKSEDIGLAGSLLASLQSVCFGPQELSNSSFGDDEFTSGKIETLRSKELGDVMDDVDRLVAAQSTNNRTEAFEVRLAARSLLDQQERLKNVRARWIAAEAFDAVETHVYAPYTADSGATAWRRCMKTHQAGTLTVTTFPTHE